MNWETGSCKAAVILAGALSAFCLPMLPVYAADDAFWLDDATGVIVAAPDAASWADLRSDGLVDPGDFTALSAPVSRAKLRSPVVTDECVGLATAAEGSRSFVETRKIHFPLELGTFTTSSPYGYRASPFTGEYELHAGSDFAAPLGTPIHAIYDGVVTFTGPRDGGYGNLTIIEHIDTDGSMIQSWYLHQLSGSQTVEVGHSVRAGQQIGSVGSTGNSTGPHLHLELHPEGRDTTIDPVAWLEAHDAVYLGHECG